MKRLLAVCLLAASLAPLRADPLSLENRVSALEKEVATLKDENRRLRESAVNFLSAELAKKETEHARLVYRTQVLPMVRRIATDFGGQAPVLPKEEEINNLVDAYRPFVELIASLNKTISSN